MATSTQAGSNLSSVERAKRWILGRSYADTQLLQSMRHDSDTEFDCGIGPRHHVNSRRWVTRDPGGFAMGDANLYRAMGNALTDGVDPSGLEDWKDYALTFVLGPGVFVLSAPFGCSPAPSNQFGMPNLGTQGQDWQIEQVQGVGNYNCFGLVKGVIEGNTSPYQPYPMVRGPGGKVDVPEPTQKQLENDIFNPNGFTKQPDLDTSLVPGKTKVAVYGTPDGRIVHAAIQTPDGSWHHKIGPGPQIGTHTAQQVTGRGAFGQIIAVYVK